MGDPAGIGPEITSQAAQITVGHKWFFDDVEQFTEVAGNKVLTDPSIFNGKINKAYLEGFLNLKTSSEMSVDYNSSANQFRSAFGMNLQGTGTTKTNMYANRYPWQEALLLFGAVNGCGAQALK